ncbi:PE family protein [Mycobacterium terramassiliense]|uniref:PE family protein n=1 Tax=Mycobacterium terramassiliense TaxID=1841859 RepID=A0A2U3N595_9MYCO|nr:PE family protein [Mycobacterium terramassiliense]SPM26697.1 PE family protein [Mycobacterium terramassiliense]
MSLLSIAPDLVSAASGNLENLGAALRSATAAAAGQTTAIAPPAADEVSAAVTALFGMRGQEFQALSAKAATFHDEFVNLLNGGAAQYVSTEAANARQTVLNAVNTASTGAAAASPAQTFSQSFGPLQVAISGGATGVVESVILNSPFGQVGSLSLSGIPFAAPGGAGVGLAVNGTGTLNTPLGPLTWLSATGSEYAGPSGFGATIGGLTPVGYQAISVTGNALGQITGGSFTTFGLEFFFQGTQFGVIPLFANLPPVLF